MNTIEEEAGSPIPRLERSNWIIQHDEESNAPFYVNTRTQKKQWKVPDELSSTHKEGMTLSFTEKSFLKGSSKSSIFDTFKTLENFKSDSSFSKSSIELEFDGFQDFDEDEDISIGDEICDDADQSISEADIPKKTSKRLEIAKEMLSTEQSYVSHISTLVKAFIEPLENRFDLHRQIDPSVALLFGNAQQILTVNRKLMKNLETKMKLWIGGDEDSVGSCIASVFIDMIDYFHVYKSFANHYDMSVIVLEKMRETQPILYEFFRSREAQPLCKGQNMNSFLITPIQRVPRYTLLLTELLRKTPEGHAQRENIEKALEMASSAADDCNNAIKSRMSREKMLLIDSKLFTEEQIESGQGIATNGRTLCYEGPLDIVGIDGMLQTFTFYLFNDTLIYAQPQPNEKLLERFPLNKLIVSQIRDKVLKTSRLSEKDQLNAFLISSPKSSFMVVAVSAALKASWMSHMQQCIDVTNEKVRKERMKKRRSTLHLAPLLHTSNMCSSCNLKFSRILWYKKRYNCIKCGASVCAKCSSAASMLVDTGDSTFKICNSCSGISNTKKPKVTSVRKGSSKNFIEHHKKYAKTMTEILSRQFKQMTAMREKKPLTISKRSKSLPKNDYKEFGSIRSTAFSLTMDNSASSLDKTQQLAFKHFSSPQEIKTCLIATESMYLAELETCVQVFLQPVMMLVVSPATRSQLIGKHKCDVSGSIAALFETFDQIRRLTSVFLMKLHQTDSKLEDVWDTYFPLLDYYFQYSRYFHPARKELSTNEGLNHIFSQCEEETSLHLDELLSLPFERLRYYCSMLEHLESCGNGSWKSTKANSLLRSVDVALCQFEQKGAFESLELLFTKSIKLDRPGRSLVMEGPLLKHRRKRKTPQVLMFHLFSDILIYSEPSRKGLRLRRQIHLSECSRIPLSQVKSIELAELIPNAFALKVNRRKRDIVLSAENFKERKIWEEKIDFVISANKS